MLTWPPRLPLPTVIVPHSVSAGPAWLATDRLHPAPSARELDWLNEQGSLTAASPPSAPDASPSSRCAKAGSRCATTSAPPSARRPAAKAGRARSTCTAPASPGCSPAAWRRASLWSASPSPSPRSATARSATCCSAIRPSRREPIEACRYPAEAAARGGARGRPVGAPLAVPPRRPRRAGRRGFPAGAVAGGRRPALSAGARQTEAAPPRAYNRRLDYRGPAMSAFLLNALARLHPRAQDFIDLTRLNRAYRHLPAARPTLTALWIAAEGVPSLGLLLIFGLGVVLTRSAGCAINDYADREFDGHVKRTRDRPLASGRVTPRGAGAVRRADVRRLRPGAAHLSVHRRPVVRRPGAGRTVSVHEAPHPICPRWCSARPIPGAS